MYSKEPACAWLLYSALLIPQDTVGGGGTRCVHRYLPSFAACCQSLPGGRGMLQGGGGTRCACRHARLVSIDIPSRAIQNGRVTVSSVSSGGDSMRMSIRAARNGVTRCARDCMSRKRVPPKICSAGVYAGIVCI